MWETKETRCFIRKLVMAVYDIVKRKLGMYLWEPRMHEETSENIHKQLLYICASTELLMCLHV